MTPAEIRSARDTLKLTAAAFAAKAGYMGKNRHKTVYRWESGERKPDRWAEKRIQRLLNLHIKKTYK